MKKYPLDFEQSAKLLSEYDILPSGKQVFYLEDALKTAEEIGYPVVDFNNKKNHMKKLSIKIIFTVGIVWMAAASLSYAGADIAVEEPIFLFGSVTEGTQVTHDFIISNPGDDVLSILRVATSCGCTVADYPKTIAPGGTGTIHVKADTSGYGGNSFKRQLIIRTDAPGKKSVRLQIEGIVK